MSLPEYHEPGRGYGSLAVIGGLLVAGIVLDTIFGGVRAHVLGWLVAAALLLGVDLLVIRAARTQKSLHVTADEVRVGEQFVSRSDIVSLAAVQDEHLPVLGWPTGMPRGLAATTLRMRDGGFVLVPTRHPDRLEAALGLVHGPDTGTTVRMAGPADLPLLADIEVRAATVFRVAGLPLPEIVAPDYAHVDALALFVVGEPPVGFAQVDEVDGNAHLAELNVLPGRMRGGLGTRLLEHAADWARAQGYPALTLITFRDVAWNAPFYARRGFEPVAEPGPGLTALRAREQQLGIDAVGPRVVMRRAL